MSLSLFVIEWWRRLIVAHAHVRIHLLLLIIRNWRTRIYHVKRLILISIIFRSFRPLSQHHHICPSSGFRYLIVILWIITHSWRVTTLPRLIYLVNGYLWFNNRIYLINLSHNLDFWLPHDRLNICIGSLLRYYFWMFFFLFLFLFLLHDILPEVLVTREHLQGIFY